MTLRYVLNISVIKHIVELLQQYDNVFFCATNYYFIIKYIAVIISITFICDFVNRL